MKNNLAPQLLEALIKFDFLLIKTQLGKGRFTKNYLNLKILNKNKVFSLLTPDKFIKNIKQFLRLLFFLKNQKKRFLTFKFNDDYFLDFFYLLLMKSNLDLKNFILTSDTHIKSANSNTGAVLFLGCKNVHSSYQKFFQNNIFLLSEFNTIFTKIDSGSYKVFSDMEDWKKYIFLILAFKSVYKIN
jgi:hypothetical protein